MSLVREDLFLDTKQQISVYDILEPLYRIPVSCMAFQHLSVVQEYLEVYELSFHSVVKEIQDVNAHVVAGRQQHRTIGRPEISTGIA